MKSSKKLTVALTAGLMMQLSLMAAETAKVTDWLRVSNVLSLEYDDNIYEDSVDPQDSFKINESVELGVSYERDASYLTLDYSPTFVWWNDREPDDNDLHHSFDATAGHEFSPRVSVAVKNLFRIAQQPEEVSRGTVVRDNGDYMYNESSASADVLVLPRTHLVLAGRYTMIDYDEEPISETDDRGISAGGATVRQQITDLSNVILDYRHEAIGYDFQEAADLRDYDSDFIGIGYEQMAANLIGIFRAGYQSTTYSNDELEDNSEPYGDVTLTYTPSPRTRFSLGAAYSMLESSIGDYASQNRTVFSASIYQDITAKIGLQVGGSYSLGEYDEENKVVEDPSTPAGGDDEVQQAFARLNYKVNARNAIELNYSYYDLTSDLQGEFDRNRVSLGWRLSL